MRMLKFENGGSFWCDSEIFVKECTINPACVATHHKYWKKNMPEISTLDSVLFFIFVVFAAVDMNYEFICFSIFF